MFFEYLWKQYLKIINSILLEKKKYGRLKESTSMHDKKSFLYTNVDFTAYNLVFMIKNYYFYQLFIEKLIKNDSLLLNQ